VPNKFFDLKCREESDADRDDHENVLQADRSGVVPTALFPEQDKAIWVRDSHRSGP
jgi:hypothetical protein